MTSINLENQLRDRLLVGETGLPERPLATSVDHTVESGPLSEDAESPELCKFERWRRLLNVMVALAGVILTAPLMAVIAVAVKLSSKGPVLYKQTRIGLDRRVAGTGLNNGRRQADGGGRPFTMYKFRTMAQDEGDTAQVWASPDDPRVTPTGRILRTYRLDELPQFINVLRGDMNIVGPRPEQTGLFKRLRRRIDGYQMRQQVLPGITGWAQINASYDASVEDVRRKLALDLEYLRRRSAREDFRIMIKTLPVMLSRRGAW